MLTLDLPAEPYWLDLPRGVRAEIRIAHPDLDPDMSRRPSFVFLVRRSPATRSPRGRASAMGANRDWPS